MLPGGPMNMLFVFLLAIVSEMQTGVMVTGHILDDRTGGPLAAVPVFLGGRPTGGNEVFRREAISDAAGGIGRASCRGRVEISGVAGSLKKKKTRKTK